MNYPKRYSITIMLNAIIVLNAIANNNQKVKAEMSKQEITNTNHFPAPKPHELKNFDFRKALVGFTENQINQHKKLYENYVHKWNKIEQDLTTADRTHNGNITYSPFRALKIGEVFARNATLLHELYFENLGKHNAKIGKQTRKLLEQNFGSVENFKQDLFECALCARGWVLTCYTIDAKNVTNFVLDAHHESVPILAIPLLVVDVYEHAYMIDFGIHRKQYLNVLWDNINWDVVEKRVIDWVARLK